MFLTRRFVDLAKTREKRRAKVTRWKLRRPDLFAAEPVVVRPDR